MIKNLTTGILRKRT